VNDSLRRLLFARATGTPLAARLLNWLAALALLAALFAFAFAQSTYRWHWAAVWRYRDKLVTGWLVTVALSLSSLVVSVVLGLAGALARRSPLLLLRSLAQLYVELVRGTPLLVQILVLFYVVADSLGLQNRYLAGALILSVFSGAYLSEIFRAGIESISRTQLDAARAVGFTRAQTYRHVIFPQALRQVLPPLAGEFGSLIKSSSLLSIIAVSELTLNAQEINTNTLSPFESYLPLAVGYLVLTLPISLFSRWLEERFRYET
jgi:polar amino acid transport system permease protein